MDEEPHVIVYWQFDQYGDRVNLWPYVQNGTRDRLIIYRNRRTAEASSSPFMSSIFEAPKYRHSSWQVPQVLPYADFEELLQECRDADIPVPAVEYHPSSLISTHI
jgi:hypothetical protein